MEDFMLNCLFFTGLFPLFALSLCVGTALIGIFIVYIKNIFKQIKQ
jgi:hypothetical protein